MKKIIIMVTGMMMALALCSCGNKTLIDTNYTFNHAIISLPNGQIIEGKVQTWNNYDDGDKIQVKIDGVVYLIHSSNVVLIND